VQWAFIGPIIILAVIAWLIPPAATSAAYQRQLRLEQLQQEQHPTRASRPPIAARLAAFFTALATPPGPHTARSRSAGAGMAASPAVRIPAPTVAAAVGGGDTEGRAELEGQEKTGDEQEAAV